MFFLYGCAKLTIGFKWFLSLYAKPDNRLQMVLSLYAKLDNRLQMVFEALCKT